MIANKHKCILLFSLVFLISCTRKNKSDNENSLENSNVKSGIEWILDEAKSDEFDSWDTNKWGTSLWYSTSSDFAFNSDNVVVEDGYLKLFARKEKYSGKNYTAGTAISKFKIGGDVRIEIRAKIIDHRARVTSALWLADKPVKESNPNVEIDMMETFVWGDNNDNWPSTKFQSTLHYWWSDSIPEYADHKRKSSSEVLGWKDKDIAAENLSDDFHIYVLERHNRKLRFYLDEEMYWTFDLQSLDKVSEPIIEQERYVIFSIEGHAGKPNEVHLPEVMLIDYVRVYNKIKEDS